MIKARLEKYRAIQLEIQALETRKRMLELKLSDEREQVLELLTAEKDDGYPDFDNFLSVGSCPLENVVAVVSIDEAYYELPVGHSGRIKIDFVPIMVGVQA